MPPSYVYLQTRIETKLYRYADSIDEAAKALKDAEFRGVLINPSKVCCSDTSGSNSVSRKAGITRMIKRTPQPFCIDVVTEGLGWFV